MKKNPVLPPAAEWDFRKVHKLSMREAARYEYARTSNLRDSLTRWLDTPIKGKLVRQHILDALVKRQKTDGAKGIVESYFAKGTRELIFNAGEKLFQNHDCYLLYLAILEHRPDFPNSWTDFEIKGVPNANFKRVQLCSMNQEFTWITDRCDQWPRGWKDYIEMRSRISADEYLLKIDFFADGLLSTVDEIVSDFDSWLRDEIKRTNQKMRVGRLAKIEQAAYPLKCLAALRLRRAGYTYEAAANALQKVALTKQDAWFIPMFENAASWTKAIKFAKKNLAELERGKLIF